MELNRGSVAALLCCALAGQVVTIPAQAQNGGSLQVSGAWSRPTPPGVQVGAVYLSITNSGTAPDRLLSASSPLAARVEFHQSTLVGGVMSMRKRGSIECPAGGRVDVSPGGLHIMLLGLKGALRVGSSFPVALHFRDAGDVAVTVSVQARDD